MTAVVCVCIGALPWHGRALGGDGTPTKKTDHPLPQYFDKLELTAEQQKKVCAIMDEYDDDIAHRPEQIRPLRGGPLKYRLRAYTNDLKRLRGQRAAALEKVLTDDQRAKLKELRAADEADKQP
jgi:Spy/CpxP family protein refolding chaperone